MLSVPKNISFDCMETGLKFAVVMNAIQINQTSNLGSKPNSSALCFIWLDFTINNRKQVNVVFIKKSLCL